MTISSRYFISTGKVRSPGWLVLNPSAMVVVVVVVTAIIFLFCNDTYLSLQNKKIIAVTTTTTTTIADGLRTSQPGDLTFPVLMKYLDDIVIVSEDEIRHAFSFVMYR